MNPLTNVALYVRDLLSYEESLIRIGRSGYEIDDYTTKYIAVDSIGSSQRFGKGQSYDGDLEVMNYYSRSSIPIVLSFYGDGAIDRATKFSLMIATQKSYDLQKKLGIAVYNTKNITDVKLLTGQQYGERIDLNFTLQITDNIDIDTLRIDEAQISILSEMRQETSA